MKLLLFSILTSFILNNMTLFDFNKTTKTSDWTIIDDGVMGGKSAGNFKMTEEGHGAFFGMVSTENNGGFSSVRHQLNVAGVKPNSKIKIRLKGDGKSYQLRIKDKSSTYYSYINTFKTSGAWEIIAINLDDMYPSFRGQNLSLPHFSGNSIQEIVFLIGNKKNESFELILDEISLEY